MTERKQYRNHAEEIAAVLAGRDQGEGAESADELVGTEDGLDEDEGSPEEDATGGNYTESPSYRSSMIDAGRGHLLP